MKNAKSVWMMLAMVLAWSVYYTVSKLMVDATGSAYAAGFLLRFLPLGAALLALSFGDALALDGVCGLYHLGRCAAEGAFCQLRVVKLPTVGTNVFIQHSMLPPLDGNPENRRFAPSFFTVCSIS